MIRKLKRRYLISNMALLSSTLLIALAILFGILYRSEVLSSYSTMNRMLEHSNLPPKQIAGSASASPTAFDLTQNENGGENPYWQPGADWQWGHTTAPVDTTTSETTTETTCESCWIPNENWYGNPGYFPPPYWPPMDPAWWGGWYWNQFPPPQDGNGDWQWQWPPMETTAVTEESSVSSETEVVFTEPENSVQEDFPQEAVGDAVQEEIPQETQTEVTTAATTVPLTSATHATTVTTVKPVTMPAPSTESEMPQTEETENLPQTEESSEELLLPEAVIARIDENGNVESFSASGTSMEQEETLETVNRAMNVIKENGDSAGILQVDDVPYRYLYQSDEQGTYHLVLLNRTLELSTISRLMFLFFFLAVIGLLLMFIVSEVLANWTVKPIATAWEKQKQFVADASHELKTPLAVISANTEVIMANPASSVTGQSKWIHYIQSETTRMSKLITNLLSIARMDNKNGVEKEAELNCSELISNVCLVFEPIIFENGKTLETVIHRNVMLRGDEDNLKQLLSILLDNAVLHSVPNAKIKVGLSKDSQGKIRLAVSNTAKDIPQEQLAHLFDRFYRVDTEGSPNGSGLGLSIAKSIVQQMGGTLTATSENQLVTFVATF